MIDMRIKENIGSLSWNTNELEENEREKVVRQREGGWGERDRKDNRR
jgi:hypothetical protein